MSKCGYNKSKIFEEAINHCRWKSVLRNLLKTNEFSEDDLRKYSDRTFDEILQDVYKICKGTNGIGMLAIYDITSAICRYNKINIDKVYIVGKGPKRALKLLDLKAKSKRLGEIKLSYVEIAEVLKAFKEKSYNMDSKIEKSKNGDDYESYICNWQKDK